MALISLASHKLVILPSAEPKFGLEIIQRLIYLGTLLLCVRLSAPVTRVYPLTRLGRVSNFDADPCSDHQSMYLNPQAYLQHVSVTSILLGGKPQPVYSIPRPVSGYPGAELRVMLPTGTLVI